MVTLTIDNKQVSVPAGTTILDAARAVDIHIPTLCYLREINEVASCRVCAVEVEGVDKLATACNTLVEEGMVVHTNTQRVRLTRKTNVELILSQHVDHCVTCVRSGNCELQKLCHDFKVDDEHRYDGNNPEWPKDDSAVHMVRDDNKCILCRRCVAACQQQHVAVIGANNRGFDTEIGCAFEMPLSEVACVSCGQCIVACPTGALTEKDNTQQVIDAINDPEKVVVVQTAPAVRAALGEEFGMPIGTNVEGKMVAALRRLGFDKVYDTDFGADMTIMEEANEFIDRVKNGGKLPIITSCSPGWVKFCEHYFPSLTENLSTCKSPQQMTGALIKTWFAEREGIDPNNIVSVSVMPCVAKKFEINRDDEDAAGVPDVDISITTRELARMIKMAQLNFARLPEEDFDPVMGVSTGAATIFGATGGVLEAALRTAADVLEGVDHDNIEYKEIRGTKGFKEAVYKVAGMDVKVAVVSGLNNANELLKKIESGEADYHIVEVMCCPGGCVGGGGQPFRTTAAIREHRMDGLYKVDKNLPIRQSHKNPDIQTLYSEYLQEPNSHLAHELLHTHYHDRRNEF